jgi:hypothetical protein
MAYHCKSCRLRSCLSVTSSYQPRTFNVLPSLSRPSFFLDKIINILGFMEKNEHEKKDIEKIIHWACAA